MSFDFSTLMIDGNGSRGSLEEAIDFLKRFETSTGRPIGALRENLKRNIENGKYPKEFLRQVGPRGQTPLMELIRMVAWGVAAALLATGNGNPGYINYDGEFAFQVALATDPLTENAVEIAIHEQRPIRMGH